ncbi:MAG: hypothetical protein EZS28_051566, partial [Streblomastix strix]
SQFKILHFGFLRTPIATHQLNKSKGWEWGQIWKIKNQIPQKEDYDCVFEREDRDYTLDRDDDDDFEIDIRAPYKDYLYKRDKQDSDSNSDSESESDDV